MPDKDPQLAREIEARVSSRTEDLAAITTELLSRVEAERSALAKELHDELGGLITAAKMDMAWLQANIGKTLDAASEEKFRSVVQMLNQAMMLKRRVVESLRPSLLDHFGLAVALRSYFEEQCGRANIECVATLPEELPDLPATAQLTMFRVAQDALTNIVSQGDARHVELVIEPEGEGYSMLVGDDGAERDDNTRSFITMRYRMAGAGGQLETESAPGQGNRLRAFVPRSRAISE